MRDAARWVHGRGGLDEARSTTSHSLVHEVLAWIQQFHEVEDRTRDLTPDERLAVLLLASSSIVERIRQRFLDVRPELRPTSKLVEAIDYFTNCRGTFTPFLENGPIPVDKNPVERLLRPVAVGGTGFVFFGSQNGGRTAATLYSIVPSARRHNVDLLAYLTDVLRRPPVIAVMDTVALDAVPRDRWAHAHLEHVVAQRVEESRAALVGRRRRCVTLRDAAE